MPNRKLPPFYVITVNYHSGHHLPELIASLSALKMVKRLIIINHSAEENLEGLEAPFPLQVVVQKNAGYGAGLNRGLREIADKGAIALLCNPDVTLLTPQRVAAALAFMADNPGVGCLIPRTLDQHGQSTHPCRTFYSWKTLLAVRIGGFRRAFYQAYREHLYLDAATTQPLEVDWGCGAAMFYRTTAFGRGAAFDAGFFLYLEDVDLCVRLWNSGLSVVYYPDLLFRHRVQRQSLYRWRFLRYHLVSLGKFIRKYHGLPQLRDLGARNQGGRQRKEAGSL